LKKLRSAITQVSSQQIVNKLSINQSRLRIMVSALDCEPGELLHDRLNYAFEQPIRVDTRFGLGVTDRPDYEAKRVVHHNIHSWFRTTSSKKAASAMKSRRRRQMLLWPSLASQWIKPEGAGQQAIGDRGPTEGRP
jgi:hypothetical protein